MNGITSHQTDPFLPVAVPATGKNGSVSKRSAENPLENVSSCDRVTLSASARVATQAATDPPVRTVATSGAPATTGERTMVERGDESPLARQQIRLKYGMPGTKPTSRQTQPGGLLHIVV
jgi:hypothetical protein